MASIINHFVWCGTLLVLALMILLAMPKSQLRCILLEIGGWLGAALAFLYVICPIDIIPDFIPLAGWIDDAGAIGGGIAAIRAAFTARRDRQSL